MQINSVRVAMDKPASQTDGGNGAAAITGDFPAGVNWPAILALVSGQVAAGRSLPGAALQTVALSQTGDNNGNDQVGVEMVAQAQAQARAQVQAQASKPAGALAEMTLTGANEYLVVGEGPAAEPLGKARRRKDATDQPVPASGGLVTPMPQSAAPAVWPAALRPEPSALSRSVPAVASRSGSSVPESAGPRIIGLVSRPSSVLSPVLPSVPSSVSRPPAALPADGRSAVVLPSVSLAPGRSSSDPVAESPTAVRPASLPSGVLLSDYPGGEPKAGPASVPPAVVELTSRTPSVPPVVLEVVLPTGLEAVSPPVSAITEPVRNLPGDLTTRQTRYQPLPGEAGQANLKEAYLGGPTEFRHEEPFPAVVLTPDTRVTETRPCQSTTLPLEPPAMPEPDENRQAGMKHRPMLVESMNLDTVPLHHGSAEKAATFGLSPRFGPLSQSRSGPRDTGEVPVVSAKALSGRGAGSELRPLGAKLSHGTEMVPAQPGPRPAGTAAFPTLPDQTASVEGEAAAVYPRWPGSDITHGQTEHQQRPPGGNGFDFHGQPGTGPDAPVGVEKYTPADRQPSRQTGEEPVFRTIRSGDSRQKRGNAAQSDRQDLSPTDRVTTRGQWDGGVPVLGPEGGRVSQPRPQAAAEASFPGRLIDQVERLQQLREERPLTNPVHRISMMLEPPELGKVEATVDLRHGEVRIQMTAHTTAGEAALVGQLDSLRTAMTERGLTVGELRVVTASSFKAEPSLHQAVSRPVSAVGGLPGPEPVVLTGTTPADVMGGYVAGQGFQGNYQGRWYSSGEDELPPLRTGSSSRRRPLVRPVTGITGDGPNSVLQPLARHEWLAAAGLDVMV